jgi:hypothetical protein
MEKADLQFLSIALDGIMCELAEMRGELRVIGTARSMLDIDVDHHQLASWLTVALTQRLRDYRQANAPRTEIGEEIVKIQVLIEMLTGETV